MVGVLWVHTEAIAGSPDVINKFKDIGKNVFFITNNSTKTRAEFNEKSLQLNFNMKKVKNVECFINIFICLINFDSMIYPG